jgi:fructoselysine and glucoselysine-specific PTS system IIB component
MTMIELVRVDDRLIHGQVAIGWVSATGTNTILVANDSAQADNTQAMALKMGTPAGVKLYIRSVEESADIVQKFTQSKNARVMVILKTISDAAELIRNSAGSIETLNVGGVRASDEKSKLSDHVYVSDTDLKDLKELHDNGVEIDFRMLPRDARKTYNQLVRNTGE